MAYTKDDNRRYPFEIGAYQHSITEPEKWLTQQVKDNDFDFTCTTHRPDLYQNPPCHQRKFQLGAPTPTNSGHVAVPQPTLNGRYDALELAELSIQYWKKPRKEFNDTQEAGFARLSSLGKKWGSVLSQLDIREVPDQALLEIVQCSEDIFFFGQRNVILSTNESRLPSGSNPLPEHAAGVCERLPKDIDQQYVGSNIIIRPTKLSSGMWTRRDLDLTKPMDKIRRQDRLSTLLHGCIHAFFHRNACNQKAICETYHFNLGNEGHGRAFQLLVKAMNDCVFVSGFRPYLNLHGNYRYRLGHYETLPTICDLKKLGLYVYSVDTTSCPEPDEYYEVGDNRNVVRHPT